MDISKDNRTDNMIETVRGLLKGRAESFELFFSRTSGLSAEARDGGVDAFKVWSNEGVGLRTISKGRLGTGFSSVLTPDALKGLVTRALDGSTEVSEDKFLILPGQSKGVEPKNLDLYDRTIENTPEEAKIDTAIRIEASAKNLDPRITRVRNASYRESVTSTRVVNSNGVDVNHEATFYTGSIMAVSEEKGESQIGFEMNLGHKRADVDAEGIGSGAARRALSMLGAKPIKTIRCPAVIENLVAIELLETLASSFLADNLHKGKSMLKGKLGKKIAGPTVNLWDDGLMPGGWASSVFDAEGVAREKTPLITEGVCRGYLYDTYWAKREGLRSTGNAARAGYKTFPFVGISNVYLEKADRGLGEIFSDMGKGLFITEVMGAHTINRVSGDFSLGASGFWVENGKVDHPVRGIAISGNLLDIFLKVEAVGSDLRFIGSIGSPSLLVSAIEASGA